MREVPVFTSLIVQKKLGCFIQRAFLYIPPPIEAAGVSEKISEVAEKSVSVSSIRGIRSLTIAFPASRIVIGMRGLGEAEGSVDFVNFSSGGAKSFTGLGSTWGILMG